MASTLSRVRGSGGQDCKIATSFIQLAIYTDPDLTSFNTTGAFSAGPGIVGSHPAYVMIYLGSACSLRPSAATILRIVSNPGIRSPERAL